jgi:hypothetical protein
VPEETALPKLPKVWGGERTHPEQLMHLYRRAAEGAILAHLVDVSQPGKTLIVFTEVKEDPDWTDPHPPSMEDALEAVKAMKNFKGREDEIRYAGALSIEQVDIARSEASRRLKEYDEDRQASRR